MIDAGTAASKGLCCAAFEFMTSSQVQSVSDAEGSGGRSLLLAPDFLL